jgi:transcriptional regulator with XRE-family HTH domain
MAEHPVMTLNQVVAANIALYRRAAGLTQRELGELIGWSPVSVSEAERSRDGRLHREFDAAEAGALALALGVPLIALFLPPPGDDESARFEAGGGLMDAAAVMGALAYPDKNGTSPALEAYRERFIDLARLYIATDPGWGDIAARWITGMGERRGEQAARFRRKAAAAREAADELDELAAAVERQEQR